MYDTAAKARLEANHILGSTTGVVSRETNMVKKTHPLTFTSEQMKNTQHVINVFKSYGGHVPELIDWEHGPPVISKWKDLGNFDTADMFIIGEQIRLLHSIPTQKFSNLPCLIDPEYVSGNISRVRSLVKDSCLDIIEHKMLETITKISDTDIVIVHDDLWPKNFGKTNTGTTYIWDWDNVGLAPAVYDCAFMVRHQDSMNAGSLKAFEDGYGKPLPSLETAYLYGVLHRGRWAVSMIERVALGEQSAYVAAEEERKWWD